MRYLLALALLACSAAHAADLRISWSPVLTYTDDADPATSEELPGAVTYEVWGSTENATPRLLVTTGDTSVVRANVRTAVHCYHLVVVHESPLVGPERSAPTAAVCIDLRPPLVGRTSGTPASATDLAVTVNTP